MAVENLLNLSESPVKHLVLQIPFDALAIPVATAMKQMRHGTDH
jgi:hypothetical protein